MNRVTISSIVTISYNSLYQLHQISILTKLKFQYFDCKQNVTQRLMKAVKYWNQYINIIEVVVVKWIYKVAIYLIEW